MSSLSDVSSSTGSVTALPLPLLAIVLGASLSWVNPTYFFLRLVVEKLELSRKFFFLPSVFERSSAGLSGPKFISASVTSFIDPPPLESLTPSIFTLR